MLVLVIILFVLLLAALAALFMSNRSRRSLCLSLRDIRLSRDNAEARAEVAEHACDEFETEYNELRCERDYWKERAESAEGKLCRKGLGKKGSKKSDA